MRTKAIFLATFVAMGVTLTAVAQTDFCQLTSETALQACRQSAQSDNSLALGNCDNLSSAGKRQTCQKQAATDLTDANQTCDAEHTDRQAVCSQVGPAPYDPKINPGDFIAQIDNPYFPLKPGTTFVYEGPTPDGFQHDEMFVSHNTKVILGVTCIEVRDRVWNNGTLIEDTLDWYAQDKEGNVWYFGENARQFADCLTVSIEGSWTGGIDSAKPGIIMKAQPTVGDFYRQEFALGTAEDVGAVQSVNEKVTVAAGTFDDCLKTKDTAPLDPGVVEFKFYAPGVGQVLETDPWTGERLQLIQIKTGG
jgi:hypothetical protein